MKDRTTKRIFLISVCILLVLGVAVGVGMGIRNMAKKENSTSDIAFTEPNKTEEDVMTPIDKEEVELPTDEFSETDNVVEPNQEPDNSQTQSPANSNGTSSQTTTNKPANGSNVTKPTQTPKGTLTELLKNGIKPMGSTMYVWGGGWNEEDTAAGIEAVTIGVSPRWAEFANQQGAGYDYNQTRYQIHDGLDCSGYIGFVVYNTLETTSGKAGYVMKATIMAQKFAEMGLGTFTPAGKVKNWQAGDIMSMSGHVWLVVGMCGDGSVVFMHCSPPGVALCGTELSNGGKSQAVTLAETYMKTYYPSWYQRYPNCGRSRSYLTSSSQMRWSRNVLSDEDGLSNKNAEEVLRIIFP